MQRYTVPTKQGDETERPEAKDAVGEAQHQHNDTFSRYSNDLFRMKAILLLSEEDQDLEADDDDDLDSLAAINQALSSIGLSNLTHLNQSNKRRRGNNSRRIQQGNDRKTRLSWELHPILLDALDDDSGAHRIAVDEEDESTENQAPNQDRDQDEREEEE
jgi:hypothetical protein